MWMTYLLGGTKSTKIGSWMSAAKGFQIKDGIVSLQKTVYSMVWGDILSRGGNKTAAWKHRKKKS